MIGAIDNLKGWRKICESHTYTGNNGGEITTYSHCCNCELRELCKKPPRERTDQEILELVKKIEKGENQ